MTISERKANDTGLESQTSINYMSPEVPKAPWLMKRIFVKVLEDLREIITFALSGVHKRQPQEVQILIGS